MVESRALQASSPVATLMSPFTRAPFTKLDVLGCRFSANARKIVVERLAPRTSGSFVSLGDKNGSEWLRWKQSSLLAKDSQQKTLKCVLDSSVSQCLVCPLAKMRAGRVSSVADQHTSLGVPLRRLQFLTIK